MPRTCILPLLATVCIMGCDQAVADSDALTSPVASESASQDPACVSHGQNAYCEGNEVRRCRDGKPETVSTCVSIETCEAGVCVPNCPSGEVYIPATGPEGFTMGRDRLKGRDIPHQVVLTKPFCMDETEVTAGAYQTCVEAKHCEEPHKWDQWASYPRFPNQPVNMVSLDKAITYCEWKGKRIPTEAQWEWAASGGENIEWPWGNEEPSCEKNFLDYTPYGAPRSAPGGDVGCRGGGPSDVKTFPAGARIWPSGKLYDMGGNVWEWTRDMAMPYSEGKQVDPEVDKVPDKPANTVYTIRGGGWNRSAIGCTVWFRAEATRGYQVPGLGFRCVREINP